MRLIITLISFLSITSSFAFTVVSNPPTKFSDEEVTVNVASNTCTNISMSPSAILDKAVEAADQFWNTAATSALELKRGDVVSADLSSDNISAAIAKASDNTILIGCSADGGSFDAFTGGIGGISSSGGIVRGALILNDLTAGKIDNMSNDTLLTLLAHEMGHAFGLHHSESDYALMYYTLDGKDQKYLSQDDIDGVTYLYPHEKELEGLLGSCGTIALIDNNDIDFWDGPAVLISNGILGFLGLLSLNALIAFFRDKVLRRFASY